MLHHADRYSQAFSKDAKKIKTFDFKSKKEVRKEKVSFGDFEAGKYKDEDAWMYSSFWYQNFDGMAYKTMLRQLISKWGVMSIEMQKAFDADMAEIREDGNRHVDNQPDDNGTKDGYIDATVSDGAEDAFARKGMDGQQKLDLGGDTDVK